MSGLFKNQEKRRIEAIDFLRGIAIIGILLVNMIDFHSPYLYIKNDYWNSKWDTVTSNIIDIFAQSSFYPLFAFLFGFGAAILAKNTTERGNHFPLLFIRRLILLLVIGAMHAFLIWHGDILITYALCGFFILLVYKLPGKTLLWVSLCLYLIPYGLLGIGAIFITILHPDTSIMGTDWKMAAQSLVVYGQGTYLEIFQQRTDDWLLVNGPGNFLFLFFSIYPFMVAGMGFAKLNWLRDVKIHRKKLLVMLWISAIAGMVLKILPYWLQHNYASEFIQDTFGGPILSLAYITSITLLYDHFSGFGRWGVPFISLGRMSLTNYLAQSLIGTMIFYSYGLGYYGRIGVFAGTLLVVIIIIFQMFFSTYWLRYYRFGPIEYGWRIFTYWKKQPLKRKEQVFK